MSKHRRQARGPHDYPRTARLNELVRQIVAEELERLDDERLTLVTVVDVVCEADLRWATVYVTGLGGPEDDAAIIEALGDHRKHLQATINRQARFKRTPELIFAADEVTRSANRIETILRELHEAEGDEPDGD
ncbi:MAG: 30S ribosome-binding factor RbfA [Acidimicrobiales bacterium]